MRDDLLLERALWQLSQEEHYLGMIEIAGSNPAQGFSFLHGILTELKQNYNYFITSNRSHSWQIYPRRSKSDDNVMTSQQRELYFLFHVFDVWSTELWPWSFLDVCFQWKLMAFLIFVIYNHQTQSSIKDITLLFRTVNYCINLLNSDIWMLDYAFSNLWQQTIILKSQRSQ